VQAVQNNYNSTQQSGFAQAGLTCEQSAVVQVSAIVQANVTLLSDSNNNEQLFINLATVQADGILLSRLRKAVPLPLMLPDTSK
jgi:hypothetical protein